MDTKIIDKKSEWEGFIAKHPEANFLHSWYWGKFHNCVFARVRPQLEDNDFSRKTFRKLGFSNAPMYLHAELTSQLDITKSEDELLRNMRKATRYEIKKALSLGIKL